MKRRDMLGMMAAGLTLGGTLPAFGASKTVRIGAIYPLTGALASTGTGIKAAIELAVDIVNNPHPDLKSLPLAAGSGLPGLGGAKLEVLFADSQGNPATGLADAQRLIDEQGVVALTGAYQSNVTETCSRVAEQRGIPYLNGESSSPALTERGYKWFFRTTPNDETFLHNMMQFLDTVKQVPTQKVAVVYENTDFGVNTYKALAKFAPQFKRQIVANIAYSAGSPSLSAEVAKLAAAKPDVAIFASYTSDALLFVRTMREMKYAPP
ncbi:MAG: ABC transporter substrate-binding protein, partial [Betaproteobacteria bacterium]|nr:ABC transporter substrate-binding protein [Betaproteobacteria bacterium]